MMRRRVIAAFALAVLAGCQDYNFNPVGKCIVQPGSARIQLSSVSTADILFVIDDSGSMQSEQQRLADNFGSFIGALVTTQKQRKGAGLDPLEFHIAITTSSVFEAWMPQTPNAANAPPTSLCAADASQPTGNRCDIPQPVNRWTSTWTSPTQNPPPPFAPYSYACAAPGSGCVDVITSYWAQCSAQNFGLGEFNKPFPGGDFVAAPRLTAPTNPRVLHFTKDLAWETFGTSAQDPQITALVQQFQQNAKVGNCGSGMEQHLEGGRLAVQKALAGGQPGVATGEWPHPGAKLVVVWLGDEDDCSSPKDPNKSLAFTGGNTSPGSDVCTQDDALPAGQRKKFPVQDYVDYFTGLGRPFGAAFIYSSDPSSCQPDAAGDIVCNVAQCACQCPPSCNGACGPNAAGACNIPADCGGKSLGTRLHDTSAGFRAKGIATVEGSVCDWNFGQTLSRIAELVKPPPGLTLPTQPAASQVAMLQIESSDGKSARLCTGPGAGTDWQFVDCKTGAAVTDGSTTSCITINHATGHCEANPGETYIAQYLGIVPTGGCATEADCVTALGGATKDWTCAKQGSAARGTCLCAAP